MSGSPRKFRGMASWSVVRSVPSLSMTKSLRLIFALLSSAFLTQFAHAAAEHEHAATAPTHQQGALIPAKDVSPEWLAKAKAAYPLNKCLVSDEALGGDMGPPADFVYRVAGKPDRLVRFCCKSCQKDFKKDPEKYLSAVEKAPPVKPAAGK